MSDRTISLGDLRDTALPLRADGTFEPERAGSIPSSTNILERALAIVAILALVAINVVGFFAALLLISSSLLLLALKPGDSVRTLLRFSPLLAIPLLAAMSTLWSDAPAQSLKLGLELILTVVAAILLCRSAPPRLLVLVMFLGFLVVCLATLPTVPLALSTGYPMIAFFGSKNELGMMAQMLFALALAVTLDRQRGAALRWLGIGGIVLAVGLLVLSQSVTAQVCAVITMVVFPVLLLFGRLPLPVRIGLVALLGVAMGAAVPFVGAISAEIAIFRGTVLNKDATLTGRTYLWEVAEKISAERPLLGHGYAAFWRQGNLDAEALWRWGGVPNKTGFNFHNAFVEMRVDLGLVGVILLALTCAGVLLIGIVRQVLRPSVPMAFIVTMHLVFYIRSYSEVGLLGQFSFVTVLWLGGAVYAASEVGRTAPAPHKPASSPAMAPRSGPSTRRFPGMAQARGGGLTTRRS